jgi:tyrosine-protein kinase Etk/Wzc
VLSTLVFANERGSKSAACYRAAAENLLFMDWQPRRVFVTSPSRGDGKTCTAFNLAWALTALNKSVLLVELNLAQPRFREVLGDLRIRHGIDSAIRGSVKPADSVFSTADGRLNVAAVRDAMNRTELKQHMPALQNFLHWGSEKYDWIILDCPSVLSGAWNSWFRENAGPSLLVVRERHTPLCRVEEARQRLGAGLKGVLLNDASDVVLPAKVAGTVSESA